MKKFEDAELEVLELDERDIVVTSETVTKDPTETGEGGE